MIFLLNEHHYFQTNKPLLYVCVLTSVFQSAQPLMKKKVMDKMLNSWFSTVVHKPVKDVMVVRSIFYKQPVP